MVFLLEIVTPQRVAYTDRISAVSVPTPGGAIGVLPKHVELFTVLGEGEVKITVNGKELYMAIGGGFMEVTREKVSLLVSRAVHADELNEKSIREAQARARQIVAGKAKGDEMATAQAILRRSILEMNVLRRRTGRQIPHTPVMQSVN